jgi:hypothetical protein
MEFSTFSTILPVLIMVTVVAAAAVSIFLLGITVGHRMARGLPPIESISFFKRKAPVAEAPKLPKITG